MLSDRVVLLRLVLSVALASLIGFERQIHRRSAGLRTHILVALGSCLIMLTSLYVFDIYKDKANVDPGRIAAGVITGIGFLGAGTILRAGEEIKGLTTAASLWLVTAIGLSVGIGFYSAGIFSTVLGLVVLFFLRYLEAGIGKEESRRRQG